MMTRKRAGYAVIIYLLYIASMYGYLFFFADTSIPAALKGTAADPQTFLNARELVLSEEYSTIRNFIFSFNTRLEWLIYFFILLFGISRSFENRFLIHIEMEVCPNRDLFVIVLTPYICGVISYSNMLVTGLVNIQY